MAGEKRKKVGKGTYVMVRMQVAFKKVLQEEAAREGRTLAGHIRYLIDQARQKRK